MHDRVPRSISASLLAAVALLGLAAQPASAKRLGGVFTAVKDANVVILSYGEGSYDVRIYGTEAPADGQPFAAEAKAFVREALLGKNGAVRFKYRNAKDEMVSRVFYTDAQGVARDLSVELAAAGFAWLRPGARYRPAGEGQVDELTAAQAEAQRARRGVWSVPNPVAPWTYRGEKLEAEGETSGTPETVAGTVDINISKIVNGDNECAIAKNPANPLQLVAHCNSSASPWRSIDGGQTWVVGGSLGSYCCDPNLAWDSFGNLFATFIDSAADNIGLGAIGAFSAMQTAPTTSSCSFGDIATSPVFPHAVVQVCGPSGGQGPNASIRINIDSDGPGAGGFGASIVATTTNVGGFDFIPAQNHRSIDPEAGLAFDRNPTSQHFGRLYLVYTDELVNESHNTNIMLRYSDDTGATWSAPIQVNTDATTRSQFLPKIASDPATGEVAICWHDARNSGTNTAMEEWCDSFTPVGFPTFRGNVRVSDGASVSTDIQMDFGDYSGLTVIDGVAHPIWADSSNSTGDNPDNTSEFDTYTDKYFLSLFFDGFEAGNSSAWSAVAP